MQLVRHVKALLGAWLLCVVVGGAFAERGLSARIKEAFRRFANGIPEQELPPLNRVDLHDLLITRGNGIVNVDLFYPKGIVVGASNVTKVTGFSYDGDQTVTFTTLIDDFSVIATYNISGKIIDVYCAGNGAAKVDLRQTVVVHTLIWRCDPNGGTHLRSYSALPFVGNRHVKYTNLRAVKPPNGCNQTCNVTDVNAYMNQHHAVLSAAFLPSDAAALTAIYSQYAEALLSLVIGPQLSTCCDV